MCHDIYQFTKDIYQCIYFGVYLYAVFRCSRPSCVSLTSPLPLKRWLRMCSRIAAKLMNSSDESSIGSAVYFSKRVLMENLCEENKWTQVLESCIDQIQIILSHLNKNSIVEKMKCNKDKWFKLHKCIIGTVFVLLSPEIPFCIFSVDSAAWIPQREFFTAYKSWWCTPASYSESELK